MDAQIEKLFATPNGDGRWNDGSGLYSKALRQRDKGIVDPKVFEAFLDDVKRGICSGKHPITPPLFEGKSLVGGNDPRYRLNGPQASFAAQPLCDPSKKFSTAIPPTVGDADYAVELAELYWASLLRDVPFAQYEDTKSHPVVAAAVDHLNANLDHYRGPVDEHGKVTPRLLFRGGLPKGKRQKGAPAYFGDEQFGPYISQFCLWPTELGAQLIDQRMKTFLPGQKFLTDPNEWFAIQNGSAATKGIKYDPARRYLRDGCGLAAFTQVDELYQAYFIAFLVLNNTWKAPPNLGIPYDPPKGYKNQKPFGTLGGPDIAATLGAVAKAAINAVWYQKWAVHLRHRPEAGAGLVHLWKTSAKPLPEAAATFGGAFGKILEPALDACFKANGSYLLSQSFPEGSPTHPAYPTGHGTVAGACITVLKFFFDCEQQITKLTLPNGTVRAMLPTDNGTDLIEYQGSDAASMTIRGELHKLGHNISFGHGIHAGIHWRSDTDESMLLGESVAISFLEKQIATYPEKCSVSITLMDGKTKKTFKN